MYLLVFTKKGAYTVTQKTEYKWIQVRVSPEEKEIVDDAAGNYNVDVSTLVRAALNYVIEQRPILEIRHTGKLAALESVNG